MIVTFLEKFILKKEKRLLKEERRLKVSIYLVFHVVVFYIVNQLEPGSRSRSTNA